MKERGRGWVVRQFDSIDSSLSAMGLKAWQLERVRHADLNFGANYGAYWRGLLDLKSEIEINPSKRDLYTRFIQKKQALLALVRDRFAAVVVSDG